MSTKALKLRSSFVLLATASILLQHAGATSSLTSSVCSDEGLACYFDSECDECIREYSDNMDEFAECVSNFESDDWDMCDYYSRFACCQDYYSANDCMGNSIFVEYYVCLANYASSRGDGGECSTLACNFGSGGGVVVDDDAVGNDDATVTDDGGVGSHNATATDDDATATDDGGVGNYNGTATDDGTVANDDDNLDSSANTGGTSGAGSSSPSAMLTYALGLAFLSVAPFFEVLL
ncbi:unnamed protein product [Ectocarpus sp. 4 AP-2014]